MPIRLTCFVIMPISIPASKIEIYNGDNYHFENIFQNLFMPAIEKAGFEVLSPRPERPELIQTENITNLAKSDLVLCDMSILNPTVFFEFGIRCALNKPVALVIDNQTGSTPFDTGIINYHSYNSALLWNKYEEIENLAIHIENSYIKSKNHNALWKHFGLSQIGAFIQSDATNNDKLDYIIQKLSTEKILIDPQEAAFSNLTRSEKKILLLICDGRTNRYIAKVQGLRDGTVRNYVSSILKKLGLSNRAEAAAYAIENGLRNILA